MNFIKRNSPIFIIGGVTVLIFLLIIVLGQNAPKGTTLPTLKEVSQEDLVTPQSYFLGNINAPVVLTEFSDFGCPACSAFEPLVSDLYKKYPNQLKVVYRNFPLPQHVNAKLAATAAQVAGEQGKFWEYGAILFQNQTKFEKADLISYAQQLDLDTEKFTSDLNSGNFNKIIENDIQEGLKLNINSTPTFFLNGNLMVFTTFQDFQDQVSKACIEAANTSANTVATSQTEPLKIIPTATPQMTQEELDKKYGVLKIAYSDEGFKPMNASASIGQVVRWTNTSSQPIQLEQLTNYFSEMTQPIEVLPGATYEIRLYKSGLWKYRDSTTLEGGTIAIRDPVENAAATVND